MSWPLECTANLSYNHRLLLLLLLLLLFIIVIIIIITIIIIIIIVIIIIVVVVSVITVFAGVHFVHQPGANHAPGASVTHKSIILFIY